MSKPTFKHFIISSSKCNATGFVAIDRKTEQITLDDSGEVTMVQISIMLFNQFQSIPQLHHCSHLMLAAVAAGAVADQAADFTIMIFKLNGIAFVKLFTNPDHLKWSIAGQH